MSEEKYLDFQPAERMRINRYCNNIFKYGIISLCYLISEYERSENYRECQLILFAISEHNKTFNLITPTRFDEDALEWANRQIEEIIGDSAYFSIMNLPQYAENIKMDVSKFMTEIYER